MSAAATSKASSTQVRPNYRGLFAPSVAPSHRAYCILFSFFFGVLEVTTGAVFYHVISLHPTSGGHPVRTPPVPLALGLIIIGTITLFATIYVALRYGFDDGDEMLEEDTKNFVKEDVLDKQFQTTEESPAV